MQQNRLGKADFTVSALTLGTMQFGSFTPKDEAVALLDLCFDKGINTIDTAEMYAVPPAAEHACLPEEFIGEWLKTKNRNDLIVATKVSGPNGMKWLPTKRVPAAPEGASLMDRDTIFAACEGSLQKMGIDVIDLYQLHWPSRYRGGAFGRMRYHKKNETPDVTSIEEQVEALNDLVKAGKIRAWGVSNENAWGLAQFQNAVDKLGASPCVSIQNDFSLVSRTFEPETAEACSPLNMDVGLFFYGGLAGGMLSGKYRNGAIPSASRHTVIPNFQPRYHTDLTKSAAAQYAELAEQNGMSPTELATAWALGQDYSASMIIGLTKSEQLGDLLKGADRELGDDLLMEIEKIHYDNPNPITRYHGVYDI